MARPYSDRFILGLTNVLTPVNLEEFRLAKICVKAWYFRLRDVANVLWC